MDLNHVVETVGLSNVILVYLVAGITVNCPFCILCDDWNNWDFLTVVALWPVVVGFGSLCALLFGVVYLIALVLSTIEKTIKALAHLFGVD